MVSKAKNANAEIMKISRPRPEEAPQGRGRPEPLHHLRGGEILDSPNVNLVVEVINDPEAAYDIVKRSMLRGIPVVSGSKTMLARHLPELIELQKTRNVALLYDASSCGSIPVIRNLEGVLRQRPAAGGQGHPERFVELHPIARLRPCRALRRRPGAGPAAGICRERPLIRHRGLRLALQAGHHHRARPRRLCGTRKDLHLRHLDDPRLGHPLRPRKRA